MELVNVSIHRVHQSSEGYNLAVDKLAPVGGIYACTLSFLLLYMYHNYCAVVLYNCQELSNGCSSCSNLRLVQNLDCIWCSRHNSLRDNTCLFIGNCPTTLHSPNQEINTTCPAPTITDFNPKSGPVEGGTTITITGTDLGVTFDDFTNRSITIRGVPCTPTDRDSYIPGRQINCRITIYPGLPLSKTASNIEVNLTSGQGLSREQFTLSTPEHISNSWSSRRGHSHICEGIKPQHWKHREYKNYSC